MSSAECIAGQVCLYWLHVAPLQDTVWLSIDTPFPKSRKRRVKHSKPDSESDRQTISYLKRLKPCSGSDENVSFIGHYSSSSSEEEVCVHILCNTYCVVCLSTFMHNLQEAKQLKKPEKPGVLHVGKEKEHPSVEQQKNKNKPSTEQHQNQEKYNYRSHSGYGIAILCTCWRYEYDAIYISI